MQWQSKYGRKILAESEIVVNTRIRSIKFSKYGHVALRYSPKVQSLSIRELEIFNPHICLSQVANLEWFRSEIADSLSS